MGLPIEKEMSSLLGKGTRDIGIKMGEWIRDKTYTSSPHVMAVSSHN